MRLPRIAFLTVAVAAIAGLAGLSFAARPAAAQYYNPYGSDASVNCTGFPSGDCTITLNSYVPAGSSFNVTLPDNMTNVTVNCSGGCMPGETFTVSVSPDMLASGFNQYVTPGACVNGSFPTYMGCTSADIYIAPVSSYASYYQGTPAYTSVNFTPTYTPSYSYTTLVPVVSPPSYVSYTPVYTNGTWWQWDNNSNDWWWSDGNDWHQWANGSTFCSIHPDRCHA
jgi:hypothetical protein